jgi:hypothetical protein
LRAATIRPNAYSLIARPCCQEFSGDPDHHDKTSSRAACHDCAYGVAIRARSIARASCAAGGGAGQGGGWPRRKTQGTAEGSATRTSGAAPRASRCRTAASTPACSAAACCGTAAPTRAASSYCGSAAASHAATSCRSTTTASRAATSCRGSAATPRTAATSSRGTTTASYATGSPGGSATACSAEAAGPAERRACTTASAEERASAGTAAPRGRKTITPGIAHSAGSCAADSNCAAPCGRQTSASGVNHPAGSRAADSNCAFDNDAPGWRRRYAAPAAAYRTVPEQRGAERYSRTRRTDRAAARSRAVGAPRAANGRCANSARATACSSLGPHCSGCDGAGATPYG